MKKIISTVIFISLAFCAIAQNKVSGVVKDSKGEPVIGAVVMVEGSGNHGTTTDMEGRYVISVPDSKELKLTYSCLSYKSQTLPVSGRNVMDVVLEDDTEKLEEVVVVGYGAMRRSDLTGSVASVKIDEENAMKSTTLDQMLEGRAAGVDVLSDSGNPDAGISVRVRGMSTFSGNSDPLYVVDGVIINGVSESMASVDSKLDTNASRDLGTTNPLSGINPQDISSIEVLKDASATAIYGSQGANGVILITTKMAQKEKPTVNFNAGISLSQATSRLDIMNFDEYVAMLETRGNTGELKRIYTDYVNHEGLKVTPVDWQDFITRTGVSQRYFVSLSGKPKTFDYYFSLGYNRNEGVIKKTDSENYSVCLNLTKNITDRIKVVLKANYGYTFSNIINGSAGGSVSANTSIMNAVQRSKPYIYGSLDQEVSEEDAELIEQDEEMRWNPKRTLDGRSSISKRHRINPSLSFKYQILKWLTFNSTFGGDFRSSESTNSRDYLLSNGLGNIMAYYDNTSLRWNWDNYIGIWKRWKKTRTFSATLGHSMSRSQSLYQKYSAKMLPQKYAYGADINEALPQDSFLSAYSESVNSLLSFFARISTNFDERYILTATVRFDGTSRFKGFNKWGVFPSGAFAWRIASEPWFNVPAISNLKLRIGWGMVGNQNIGNYLTTKVFGTQSIGNHFNESQKETAIVQKNIVNEDLKWETTEQWNAGLDLSLFRGRIALTAEAYDKKTRDLLQTKPISSTTGFSTMSVNDGVIRNRGLEFTLETVPVKTPFFEWTIGGNIGINRNNIEDIGSMGSSLEMRLSPESEPRNVSYFLGKSIMSYMCSQPVNIFIEGQPMGLFYGYVFDGIVQEGEYVTGFSGTQREAGLTKFKDLNNDGVWNEQDKTIIGNPNPDFTYGFRTSLSFKRLSLSMTFSGAAGCDRANFNNIIGYYTLASKNSNRNAVANAWTVENKSNVWPKLGAAFDSEAFSDRFIEDGSYLRMSNISLSYNFSLPKTNKVLHGLGLSASVGNPFVWTKYSGHSPVVNNFGNDVGRMGVDFNTTPYPRSFNFDVKFTF